MKDQFARDEIAALKLRFEYHSRVLDYAENPHKFASIDLIGAHPQTSTCANPIVPIHTSPGSMMNSFPRGGHLYIEPASNARRIDDIELRVAFIETRVSDLEAPARFPWEV